MANNFLFKKENEDLFWQYWRQFIAENKVGPKYLPASVKTNLAIAEYRGKLLGDKSFIYLIGSRPAGIVSLPIEKAGNHRAISIDGGFIEAPLGADDAASDIIFEAIDQLAKENDIAKIMLASDPLGGIEYNYLQKYDYLDASILEYVITAEPADDFLRACRKGHQCDIKKILSNGDFKIFYVAQENAGYESHEEYRALHYKCAGRVTWPKEIFDIQFEKLKQGNAVLFGLKYKQKNIAFSYFDFNFDKAIYHSGSDDPDYDKLPLYHIMIYSGAEYLRKKGVRLIDTGQPASPSAQTFYHPDEKQRNIAKFKRGFGGRFVSFFRGVKYFDNASFKEDMANFARRYKETIPETV